MKKFLQVRMGQWMLCLIGSVMLLAMAPAHALSAQGQVYGTPEAAVEALVQALRGENAGQLLDVLGGGAHELVLSGDTTQDLAAWRQFVRAYETAHTLEKGANGQYTLLVGASPYPFTVPLRKLAGGWQFDVEAGIEESINRRIGRNELTTIEVMRQIVLAQEEFFLRQGSDRSAGQYAARFESTPGSKDGLYWAAAPGEAASPLGPLIAAAASQGYSASDRGSAFFGYRYRMLPGQGKSARGGAREYTVNGRQLGGFAVLAWPVSYGVSGVKSFMVNQDGVVLERDLGPNTEQVAGAVRRFEPGMAWKPVAQR